MRTSRFLALLVAALSAVTILVAPAGAVPLEGVRQIDAGNGTTCALVGAQLRCWGDNQSGQVGDGTTDDRALPTVVLRNDANAPLLGVTQVDAGFNTCARLRNGQARCWGDNSYGALGDGTTDNSPLPRTVLLPSGAPLTGVAAVAAGGDFSCARLTNGEVRCWGKNEGGQIGDGTHTNRRRARLVTVPGGGRLTGVVELSAGRFHSCARLSNGQVRCWGDNTSGALGDGTTTGRARARVLRNGAGTGPLRGAAQVVAGDDHTCIRISGGQVRCVGANDFGGLGDGTTEDRHLPVAVRRQDGPGRLTGVTRLATSIGYFNCARIEGAHVVCWGWNGDGGLGDGTTDDRSRPVDVLDPTGTIPLSNVAQVSVGGGFGCARLVNGQARCWGDNADGQLGDGTTGNDHHLPVVVQL
jgi:alpha-tubulin suppressor-like RCC1 family protein